MICRGCAFETERLLVNEWHAISSRDWPQQDLAYAVATMLTEPVTRSLPVSWQGSYTVERAREWIEERDREGTTLVVVDKSTKQAVGLMILFETDAEDGGDGIEVRLGYLLSESAWGQGFASKLVRGFVGWCRGQTSIASIAGGVAQDNLASKRVLEKNGFRLVQSEGEVVQDEQFFRLQL
ncbi:GNAT family N-acetyltransferase [Candidatus Entotheonella palauensis]|uniref:GNAT family N-acetyltransferase n=1 Tax=Candidatus Entotheonella palauensis TaxID=93172 RepID=UPI000B7DCC36|nr:GNAT family N-acetyltransferase [Candidatus Entotheonella palauensis]